MEKDDLYIFPLDFFNHHKGKICFCCGVIELDLQIAERMSPEQVAELESELADHRAGKWDVKISGEVRLRD